MHRQSSSPRHGAALVDVIAGGVILAIGLSAIVNLTTRSLTSQTDGEKHLTASWLADEILNMVLVEGPAEYPRLFDTNGRYASPFDEFEYNVEIDDQGVGRPYRVVATIRWESARGHQQVNVGTFIAERGGEEEELRIPFEPVDREERWYEDEDY